MTDELKQQKVISKLNTGFPDYLDFDKLRKEGIAYLGKLSGKLWTDHNVHDPGITILEVLCYALLDLGYRTNLPVADLLTKNPEDNSSENNFFTPAQILTNNPLTITDFRKLLIDIPDIKNAWLEIAKDVDIEKFCRRNADPITVTGSSITRVADDCCDIYINGLYHVYIDLEKNIEEEFKNKPDIKERYKFEIINKVTTALLGHRNFCEDFIDIRFLCKLEIGVCADIELENGADAAAVYLQMADVLYSFFSPSPVFYTLPQLLEKGKSIDEIFAGRPLSSNASHGFVDTTEFEKLKLRKEIHLSDVYNVLLGIKGVRRVQHLRLRKCFENNFMAIEKWKFLIPENNIPEFSIACSGFQFLRYGVPVVFDFKSYDPQIEIAAQQNGKILYPKAFPELDCEIPKGIYRNDLDLYYSIQNEFPRVYGISEGGLAADSTPARKAQALQLKGYLLFFDQLLASYLTQLKNIRSLFAINSTSNENDLHTYFVNKDLQSVPDLAKLLRFTSAGNLEEIGSKGSSLVMPVDKSMLLQWIESGTIKNIILEDILPFPFESLEATDIAVAQLMEDINNNNFDCHIIEKTDECVFFYILSTSDCIGLISKRYFSNETEAKLASESLSYIAGFAENYRVYLAADNNFSSFDIEFNLSDYTKYLQLIAEDKQLYERRRQSFLNHLLSRFAEQFTDYALLSYNNNRDIDNSTGELIAKETFLSNYPDLSSNRGKGYDYKLNGWNNDNIAGFEKKFKAYSGIKNWKRHSLCNYEVARYENKFVFNLAIGDKIIFKTGEVFNSKEDARHAIRSLLTALKNNIAFRTDYNSGEQTHSIKLDYHQKQPADFTTKFKTIAEADQAKNSLQKMFSGGFSESDIYVHSYLYNARLASSKGEIIKTFHESAENESNAKKEAIKHIAKVNDSKVWNQSGNKELTIGKLVIDSSTEEIILIDSSSFKIDISNTIIGKPDKYTYELLDKKNTFKLKPTTEFDDEKSAKQHSEELILLLPHQENIIIERNSTSGNYSIIVKTKKNNLAVSVTDFESEQSARNAKASLVNIIENSCYKLLVHQFPHTWKYKYILGYQTDEQYVFQSNLDFKSKEEAFKNASQFAASFKEMQLKVSGKDNELALTTAATKNSASLLTNDSKKDIEAEKKQLTQITALLKIQQQALSLINDGDLSAYDRFIEIDEASRSGLYVYRLVDKDNLYASFTAEGNKKEEAEVFLKEAISFDKKKYNYLDLYLKGDIIRQRKDEHNSTTWFHYQLKSANLINNPDGSSSQPLILFESTKGYTSREEAEKAFEDNYFKILSLASLKENYLASAIISTKELLIHADDACTNTKSIVFVPKETLDYLGAIEEKAIEELIKVVKSYPLKTIFPKADCKEFHNRFKSCEEGSCNDSETTLCGNSATEKPFYYFSLYNKQTNKEDWQSVKYYDTAKEAWKAFQFFELLLNYPGNYFIDCACKSFWNDNQKAFESIPVYKIFLREVLAESAGRFLTEEQAWGTAGLKKLIDTSQSVGSFHTYLNKNNCCYSFYIACSNLRLYHPCKYNTPEQRDKAASLLFTSLEQVKNWKWDEFCTDLQPLLIIKDFEGTAIASLRYELATAQITAANYFEWYTEILTRISLHGICIENGKVYLRGKSISFQSTATGNTTTAEELKEKLSWLAAFFPFSSIKITNGRETRIQYCIEIKLPAFNNDAVDDCENYSNNKGTCYTAWKSDCCYDNCASAIEAYKTAILLLSTYDNYKPVYDCLCNSYGIALHFVNTLPGNNNKECGYLNAQNQRIVLPCENEIVAYNP
ncbi:MAG: hypothetical protein ACKVOW_16820, partial [Chitinophagaceae bacterium]